MILTETLQFTDFIISAGAAVIAILLAMIGYFLKLFGGSVIELKHAVEQLTIMVSVEQEKAKNHNETNEIEHAMHDKDIENLYNKVEIVEKDLLVIKTKLQV